MASTSFFGDSSGSSVLPNDFSALMDTIQAANVASAATAASAAASKAASGVSQVASAASATTASTAATTAVSSATAAGTSATSAASSLTLAQAQALSATNSATSAAQSIVTVTASQAAALDSQNAAKTSETNAATSAAVFNLKANIASPTFTGTVGGITSAMVGLGNAENKSSATIRGELTTADIHTATSTTGMSMNCSFEKTFTTIFPADTGGNAVDLQFPNLSFNGVIDVEICGTFSQTLANGIVIKRFAIGVNPNGSFWNNVSQVVDTIGSTPSQFSIGDLAWDATNLRYYIPISHLTTAGNPIFIRVRGLVSPGNGVTLKTQLTLGALYARAVLPANVASFVGSVVGNASTATKLATPRNINGVAFDGTADIALPAISSANVVSALGYAPSRQANFSTASTASVIADTGSLRTVVNPFASLGYASGVRFRFGLANDVDTALGCADIIDLSTYADASGGGVNSLYINKNSQLIQHKWAAAGVTAWTTKTVAYTTDNVASATKLATARTINGISFDGSANITLAKADVALGNVDNTADTAKPVSTAQQTALNLKAQLGGATSQDFAAKNLTVTSVNGGPLSGFRNRIINGNMLVNQRVATSTTAGYLMDRWAASGTNYTFAYSDNGFVSVNGQRHLYLQCAVAKTTLATNDYMLVNQGIEGYNLADLRFGSVAAQPFTVSFRAQASVAGTYYVSLRNSVSSRSYVIPFSAGTTPASYSFTIPGDTAGTWVADANFCLTLGFCAASGTVFQAPTNNVWATGNYISGAGQANGMDTVGRFLAIGDVQLEEGTVATPFEFRSFNQELALCQRYYETGFIHTLASASGASQYFSETARYKVTKRAIPSSTLTQVFQSISSGYTLVQTTLDAFTYYSLSTGAGTLETTGSFTAAAEL